jgi:hypothetical protein
VSGVDSSTGRASWLTTRVAGSNPAPSQGMSTLIGRENGRHERPAGSNWLDRPVRSMDGIEATSPLEPSGGDRFRCRRKPDDNMAGCLAARGFRRSRHTGSAGRTAAMAGSDEDPGRRRRTTGQAVCGHGSSSAPQQAVWPDFQLLPKGLNFRMNPADSANGNRKLWPENEKELKNVDAQANSDSIL